ncbi:MAG: N-6 DNA methylase [Candidatus Obscuribacterales bacterium]|nr:N-6 DNA methylase [Candidatus Obscuribacterales bacterium]
MPKSKKPSDQNAAKRQKLHGQQFSAIRQLVRRLKKLVPVETNSQYDEAVLAYAALLSLAARQIMPEIFQGKPAGIILSALTDELRLDKSQFADVLVVHINDACLTADKSLIASLKEILLQAGSQEIAVLSDPLLVGWVYQCLLFERRNSFTKSDALQRISSDEIQLSDLPVLTQWFTPDWISKFLVAETIALKANSSDNDFTFIDPCLGTGHIFVEALKARFASRGNLPAETCLTKILADELFGCDIDRKVVEIAGFSIYLACRDLAPIIELPLPQIFYFEEGVGSLCLPFDEKPGVEIYSLVGKADIEQLRRKYSAVITNPPYLSHRLMPKELSNFLKDNYPLGRFDLYAAFLEFCMKLVEEDGVFALICQQSFMSITRYEKLRQELLEKFSLKTIVQLGSGVFASRKGEKVSNAIIIAQLNKQESATDCFRILSDEEQAIAQIEGIRNLPKLEGNSQLFWKFPGQQFAFWCPAEILALFDLPALESSESGIESANGLFTCNNKEFVKFFWQVDESEAGNYVPYDKGGGYKWHYTTPLRLNWRNDGKDIRDYRKLRGQSVALPGERYYFKPGVTYSYIGTRGFKARLLSPDSIFDIASSALFTDDPHYLLGYLNSSLARFLLGVLNPTVNFQIGDLRRLPYKKPSLQIRQKVAKAVNEAIELARRLEAFDSQSPNYKGPVLRQYTQSNDLEHLADACVLHREKLSELNELEASLQKAIDDEIFAHYGISAEMRTLIENDPWVSRNQKLIGDMPSDKQLIADCIS